MGRSGVRYRKFRKFYEERLRNVVIPEAKVKRRIWFTRQYALGKRYYDYQNLVGGFKPLLDVILRNNWLIDDAPKWCQDFYQQEPSPTGQDQIKVVIEECHA